MDFAKPYLYPAFVFWLFACWAGPVLGDWPHLRGPNYDGVSLETGLAENWPAEGPPVLWTHDLGQGYSGFIVAEGKVFTQGQGLGGQFLYCLDLETGQCIWKYRYDWSWQPRGAYPGPYATPTYYQGKVFYTSPTGMVGCVASGTGQPLWSVNLKERFQGKGWEFGYAATPLVEDDKVILPVGGPSSSLVALDVADGHTLWSAGKDSASYCPALPLTLQGRRCVVGYLQNALLICDLRTGEVLHRQTLSADYDEHSAWPIYQEPHLLLLSPFRVPAQFLELGLSATETAGAAGIKVRSLWTSKELCNDILASVLYQNHVYGFDLRQYQASPHRTSRGTFRCLEWSTGKVRWSTEEVGHASVLAADGKLILLNDTGTLILARADPEAYHELARFQLFEDALCWTPPTLWQGRLLVRSPARACCINLGRAKIHPETLETTLPSSPQRSWRLDPTWLMWRERDFPNDALGRDEILLWFSSSLLLVFGSAALLLLLARWSRWLLGNLHKRFFSPDSEFSATPGILNHGHHRMGKTFLYWTLAFILGLLGPNLFSSCWNSLLFTWPASLYSAFALTLQICLWAETTDSHRQRGRWLARATMIGFLLVGYGYFELCKTVGMFIAWAFLFGLLPAFPFTMLAARSNSLWQRTAWTLIGFAIFFWTSQALLVWKSQ